MERLALQWMWTPEGWRENWGVAWENGFITEMGPAQGAVQSHKALLPGLVNSHSHAFQRLIRGSTEYRHPERSSDDFWSWRELMYQAALLPNPDQLESVARLLYLEMVESGITCVGEFHYQHHQSDGSPYANPDEMALRLVAAARWAGLEIVLLRCAYARSGYQVPPNPRQIRFLDSHWEDCAGAVERLRTQGIAVGVAPHSVRAVPLDWLGPLCGWARSQNLPVHMHVSEQPLEIEQCLAETGLRPVQWLARQGILGADFTAVHAIHLGADEIQSLGQSHICSCPTTERNLGDGIVPALQLRQAGSAFTLGSDSQCQIDLWEDARQLDYHLRLLHQQRAVLDQPAGQLEAALMSACSLGGASSLAQPCGLIEVGRRADFVVVDLNCPRLAATRPEGLIWSLSQSSIEQVYQAGCPRLQSGRHPKREEALRGYRQTLKELQIG